MATLLMIHELGVNSTRYLEMLTDVNGFVKDGGSYALRR
jgi:hypothetical protein